MKHGVGDAVRIGALPLGSSSRAAPAPHGGRLDIAVLNLAFAWHFMKVPTVVWLGYLTASELAVLGARVGIWFAKCTTEN